MDALETHSIRATAALWQGSLNSSRESLPVTPLRLPTTACR